MSKTNTLIEYVYSGQGIDTFEISLQDKKVSVTSSLSAEEVLNVIKKTGKTTELISSS